MRLPQLLTSRGVFPTAQRVDIALLTLRSRSTCRPSRSSRRFARMGSRISKATVYNTLNLFCERGLLRTVDVDPTRQFYDSSTSAHHHFYNVDTGELTDIPLECGHV